LWRDLGNGFDVFHCPKEIRRLNQNARRIVAHRAFQFFQVDAPRIRKETSFCGIAWCVA